MTQPANILVTGGFGRLGVALTAWLEREGHRPIITSRDAAKVERFNGEAEQSGRAARAIVMRLDDEHETRSAVAALVDRVGAVHGLVNNAYADLGYRAVGDVPWSHWSEASRITLAAAETIASALVERRATSAIASVVNLSSIYGLRAPDFGIYGEGREPSAVYYGAMKAGVLALTRYLAAYWGPIGVRVNAVTPGGIAAKQEPDFAARYGSTVPTGRMVSADEVSAAIGFLLGPASSGITGTNVVVDGGKTIW